MSDIQKAELLRSLGRVVRGLSTLFWGLPAALVVYVQTARTDWLDYFGMLALVPALVVSAVLCVAFFQLRGFQKQERIWQQSLDRAEIFSIINFGLAPFLFWWHRFPYVPLYAISVMLLTMCSIMLLIQINRVLLRLAAMLPDEMLRAETRMFTNFNTCLLAGVFSLLGIYFGLMQFNPPPYFFLKIIKFIGADGVWLMLFLLLMPLAMTMAMIWKIKELIFGSLFDVDR